MHMNEYNQGSHVTVKILCLTTYKASVILMRVQKIINPAYTRTKKEMDRHQANVKVKELKQIL